MVGFQAADLTREHRLEDPRVVQRLHERRRDAPLLEDLRVLTDQRFEAARDIDEVRHDRKLTQIHSSSTGTLRD